MIQYIKKRKHLFALLLVCILAVIIGMNYSGKQRDKFAAECGAKNGEVIRMGFDDYQPVCAKVEIIK